MAAAPKLSPSELARQLQKLCPPGKKRKVSRRAYIEQEKARRRRKYIATLQRHGRQALALEMMQDMLALLNWLMNDPHYRTQDLRPGEVFGPDWRRELFGAAATAGGVKAARSRKRRR